MDRLLGGKNGKLKCECGRPRYPKYNLCPSCYYNSHKWYAFKGYYNVVTRSDGDTEIGSEICGVSRASSLSHAISKFGNRLQWVSVSSSQSFKTEEDALIWIYENCQGVEFGGVR